MNIYLVRHGETDWNREGRLQGHTDIPLNENGRMQMKQVATKMVNLDIKPDLILASPLTRAYESAEIIAEQLAYGKENILLEPLLIERYFGVGEGKILAERVEKYPGDNYPQMESYEDLIRRAESVFEKIVNLFWDKQNVLLVAHGAILYAILTAITGEQIEYGGDKVRFEQGSIHLLKYSNGAFELASYNEKNLRFMGIGKYYYEMEKSK